MTKLFNFGHILSLSSSAALLHESSYSYPSGTFFAATCPCVDGFGGEHRHLCTKQNAEAEQRANLPDLVIGSSPGSRIDDHELDDQST